jgi:hypothetical protein
MSNFAIYAAGIATTSAVYLSSLCALYLALARQKWWTYLRLDVICGAVLLFVLDVAWWAKCLDKLRKSDDGFYAVELGWRWLPVILDIALCLLAAGVVVVAIYVAPKLSKMNAGNVSGPSEWVNPRASLTGGCSYRPS